MPDRLGKRKLDAIDSLNQQPNAKRKMTVEEHRRRANLFSSSPLGLPSMDISYENLETQVQLVADKSKPSLQEDIASSVLVPKPRELFLTEHTSKGEIEHRMQVIQEREKAKLYKYLLDKLEMKNITKLRNSSSFRDVAIKDVTLVLDDYIGRKLSGQKQMYEHDDALEALQQIDEHVQHSEAGTNTKSLKAELDRLKSAWEHQPESAQGTASSSQADVLSSSHDRGKTLSFIEDFEEDGLPFSLEEDHATQDIGRSIAGSSSDTREQWTPAQYSGTIGTLRIVQAINRNDFYGTIMHYQEGSPIRQTLENLRDMVSFKGGKRLIDANTDVFVKAWDDAAIASDDSTKMQMRNIIAYTEVAINSGARPLNF